MSKALDKVVLFAVKAGNLGILKAVIQAGWRYDGKIYFVTKCNDRKRLEMLKMILGVSPSKIQKIWQRDLQKLEELK